MILSVWLWGSTQHKLICPCARGFAHITIRRVCGEKYVWKRSCNRTAGLDCICTFSMLPLQTGLCYCWWLKNINKDIKAQSHLWSTPTGVFTYLSWLNPHISCYCCCNLLRWDNLHLYHSYQYMDFSVLTLFPEHSSKLNRGLSSHNKWKHLCDHAEPLSNYRLLLSQNVILLQLERRLFFIIMTLVNLSGCLGDLVKQTQRMHSLELLSTAENLLSCEKSAVTTVHCLYSKLASSPDCYTL